MLQMQFQGVVCLLELEFMFANLVYSKSLFLIYCFCSFIMSAIKGDILNRCKFVFLCLLQ